MGIKELITRLFGHDVSNAHGEALPGEPTSELVEPKTSLPLAKGPGNTAGGGLTEVRTWP